MYRYVCGGVALKRGEVVWSVVFRERRSHGEWEGEQRLVVVLPDSAAAAAAKFYLTSILGRCSGSLGLSSAGLGSRSLGGCWDGLLYNPSISNLLVCRWPAACRVVSCCVVPVTVGVLAAWCVAAPD
jgi:hypothetical protein